jgi:hypothetical protein
MKITKRNSSFTLHKNLEYINNKKELKTECSIQKEFSIIKIENEKHQKNSTIVKSYKS